MDPPSPKNEIEVRSYISSFKVIDNQKTLSGLSQKAEPNRNKIIN